MDPLARRILAQAREAGATQAGLADLTLLKTAPSTQEQDDLEWPEDRHTVLVLAVAHPESEPELDWWGGTGGTAGNRLLIQTSQQLQHWLGQELDIPARDIPYQVDRGGIFLKDAAALAGLGTIGDNNLLVTPEHGPRVRLRAMFLDRELPSTGPLDFRPCHDCDRPCLAACPVQAFPQGAYTKLRCSMQMQRDEARPVAVPVPNPYDMPAQVIAYCRQCELTCPVGRDSPQPSR